MVKQFLGMTNFLAKICKDLADYCESLQQLTHQGVELEWSKSYQQIIEKIN